MWKITSNGVRKWLLIMTELHFTLDFIRGMSFGLEFPDTSDEEDLKLAVVIDLAILRLVFLFWNTNE